jgi:hypothetical protein
MLINDTLIRNTKPAAKPRKLFDGNGLLLLVQPNGSRWGRLEYRFDGAEKTLSLGVYPQVSLKQARERREALRKQVAEGVDPSAMRKAEKRAQANTFEAVVSGTSSAFQTGRTNTRGCCSVGWSGIFFRGSDRSPSPNSPLPISSIACSEFKSAEHSKRRIV